MGLCKAKQVSNNMNKKIHHDKSPDTKYILMNEKELNCDQNYITLIDKPYVNRVNLTESKTILETNTFSYYQLFVMYNFVFFLSEKIYVNVPKIQIF